MRLQSHARRSHGGDNLQLPIVRFYPADARSSLLHISQSHRDEEQHEKLVNTLIVFLTEVTTQIRDNRDWFNSRKFLFDCEMSEYLCFMSKVLYL